MCKQITFCLFLLLGQTLGAQNCLEVMNCPASGQTVEFCDLSANDEYLWNEPYWWNSTYETHDLHDNPTDLQFSVDQSCGGALTIYYQLFLDLNGDHAFETVVDSRNLPGFNTIRYGNGPDAPYDDGEARAFDERLVSAGEKYGFALALDTNGTTVTASVRWNTAASPDTYVTPQLPLGQYLIRWVAEENGNGEQETCEYSFVVKDCKPPTIVCYNGLIINLLVTGFVTVWAVDFLQYAEDNASSSALIEYSIRKTADDDGSGFPGTPSVVFNCTEVGTQGIQLWARDQAGNTAYCETYIIVEGPSCLGGAMIQMDVCVRQWCDEAILPGVEFGLLSSGGGPAALLVQGQTPQASGCYSFLTEWPQGSVDYMLVPQLDSDPLNGVDALDLVRISQHILGLATLPPYAMIAADANKSSSITAFDIVEIRKLITGLYTELPSNTSWRFLDGTVPFINPLNPFGQVLPESGSFSVSSDTTLAFDFLGVKTGDVDCSAMPGLQAPADSRAPVMLQWPDRVLEPGETAELDLRSVEAAEWLALQLALRFDPAMLEVDFVSTGVLPSADGGECTRPEPGLLHLVWYSPEAVRLTAGAPVLKLRIRALRALRLRDALHLAVDRLLPRAFDAAGDRHTLVFGFDDRGETGSTAGLPFPNPTGGAVGQALFLSGENDVEMRVYDAQGRLVFHQMCRLLRGAQTLEWPAEAFPRAGLYLWEIRAGEAKSTGKIVRQ